MIDDIKAGLSVLGTILLVVAGGAFFYIGLGMVLRWCMINHHTGAAWWVSIVALCLCVFAFGWDSNRLWRKYRG